jgi:hypothetical protein
VGSVVVAFTADMNQKRRPVVGFIGPRPGILTEIVNLEARLLDCGVQFGLEPHTFYRLNAKTHQFEPVSPPKRKRKKR